MSNEIITNMSPFQAFVVFYCWTLIKTEECEYKPEEVYGGVEAICSKKHFNRIPKNLPDNTTYLDLTYNNITELHSGDFNYLMQLRYLDISFNPIHTLQSGSLVGLSALLVFELNGHELNYSETSVPIDVFTPLKSLVRLSMRSFLSQFQRQPLILPDQALSKLPKLTNLSIDTGHGTYFKSGFSKLTQLKYLVIGDINGMGCGLDKLTNRTFQGLASTPVLFLDMSGCIFDSFDVNSFVNLTNLQYLYMDGMHVSAGDIAIFIDSLHVFKNKTMSVISISSLRSNDFYVSNGGGGIQLRRIEDICVSKFDVSDSYIYFMDFSGISIFTSPFVKCIKELNVRRNRIRAANLDKLWFLFLPLFEKLEKMDVSLQSTLNIADIPNIRYRHKKQSSTDIGVPVRLPPNIKYLHLAGMSSNIGPVLNLYFFYGRNLKLLNISYSGLFDFNKTLVGIENIETLDISFNDASTISSTFFDTLPNLKTLGISNCLLDNDFILRNGTRFLRPLTQLESIDLSGNQLIIIPYDLFKSLHKLRYVNLATNSLINIPDISHLYHLTFFDIGHNALTTINATYRQMLETSQKNSENLFTSLQGNTFSCACEDSEFLLWLYDTNVQTDSNNYSCIDSQGQMTYTKSIRWGVFQQRCRSSFWLNVAIGTTSFTILTLTMSFVFVKNEMKLKLFFLRLINQRVRSRKRSDFLYDAFIIYTDSMCGWVCTELAEQLEDVYRLKLNLPDRDHIPGGSKAEDITEAIRDSWKIVLILSPEFLTSDLAYYTMCSCVSCITLTTPQRLIVVIDEDMRLPANLDFLLEPVTQTNILNANLQSPFAAFPSSRLAKLILQKMLND